MIKSDKLLDLNYQIDGIIRGEVHNIENCRVTGSSGGPYFLSIGVKFYNFPDLYYLKFKHNLNGSVFKIELEEKIYQPDQMTDANRNEADLTIEKIISVIRKRIQTEVLTTNNQLRFAMGSFAIFCFGEELILE